MRREVNFLRGITSRTTLPVPNPIFTNLDTEQPGELFMGYRLLPGVPLWRPDVLAQTDEAVLDRWASRLAGFLRELHAIPPALLPGEWPVCDGRQQWAVLYEEIRKYLFPLIRPDARREIREHFEAYLDDPALHDYAPTPRHGDFGSGNILFDPDSLDITGIIDFGFAAVGDPALDIAAVSTLGDALFGRFPAIYSAIETMLPRARFYRGTYALQEALHGYKSGDEEAFKAGMARYV
jgi:aminoglycoside 2''-phosphotransferase